MDKQKQIEEMAKEIEKSYTAYRGFCPHNTTVCSTVRNCMYCNIATHLIEQGYRKITENEIVISKEEYDKLKQFEYQVRSGVCFTQKMWFDFCIEDSKHQTSLQIKAKEQGCKETAEKIIKWFKENSVCIPSDEDISDFAKEFGVDLGDNNGK
jgi:hypothetical protein